jgi:hypothetical protein
MKREQTERPIDFVITWVDGSDAAWQEEKKRCIGQMGEKAVGDGREERYRDWEELPYWFRGVEKYASFVNKIHFVTWGHLPKWLNTANPKLHIVRHEDFIPEQYRPTFNSNAIEMNLHRIPGLSEHFVYFNDDIFLLQPAKAEDFFRDGRPCDMLAFQPVVANPDNPVMSRIFMNNALVLSKHFDKRENVKIQPGNYFKIGYPPLYFFYNLLELAFPLFTGFYNSHGPAAFCKSTFEELWDEEEETLHKTCMHTFRGDDVSQYLMRDWQKLNGNFYAVNMNRRLRYFDVSNHNEELIRTIQKRSVPCVCINDANRRIDYEKQKALINQALESVFPEKSSFETKH